MASRRKKKGGMLRRFLLVIVLLAAGGYFFGDTVLAWATGRGMEAVLGVETTIGDVDVEFGSDGGMVARGIELANPEGFSPGPMLQVEKVAVPWPEDGVFKRPAVIPRILVQGAKIRLEQRLDASNHGWVLERLQRNRGEGGGGSLVIRELVIEGAEVALDVGLLGASGNVATVTIPEIRLAGLGDTGDGQGLDWASVAGIVLEAVLGRVAGAESIGLPSDVKQSIERSLQKFGRGTLPMAIPPVPGIGDVLDKASRIFEGR